MELKKKNTEGKRRIKEVEEDWEVEVEKNEDGRGKKTCKTTNKRRREDKQHRARKNKCTFQYKQKYRAERKKIKEKTITK